MTPPKLDKNAKNISAENRDNMAKRRQEVLILHVSVHLGLAYKPCTWEICHSSKPNAWILVHVQATKHPDPMSYKWAITADKSIKKICKRNLVQVYQLNIH